MKNQGKDSPSSNSVGGSNLIIKTAFWMAALTMVSKIFGFVRELVIAGFYGTSYITDSYVMANAIPGIIFGGIFGAVSTAYMPIYSKIREHEGIDKGNYFTSEIINLLLIFSIFSGVLGLVFSDQIVQIFASGFTGKTAELTSFFLKISFWYIIFSSTAAILDAYLQYSGIFLPQIAAGYGQNIGIITVVIISAYTSHYFIVFGMLLGTAARALIVWYYAQKNDYQHTKVISVNKTITEIMGLALPVFISVYIVQISTFVDKTMASRLIEGSVSALNYAMILVLLISSMTSTILVTIIYPKLTKANSLDDEFSFNSIVSKGLSLIFIIIVPCTLGAMTYYKEIVQIVYERGAFNTTATSLTSSAFFYYSIGLLFMSANDLLVRVSYSVKDMRLPLICGVGAVIIDVTLNIILVQFMAHNGLALSTSIAAICNTIFLVIGLRKKHPNIDIVKSKKKYGLIVLVGVIAVLISKIAYIYIALPFDNLIVGRVIQLSIAVVIACMVYLLLLHLLKIDETKLIKQLIKK